MNFSSFLNQHPVVRSYFRAKAKPITSERVMPVDRQEATQLTIEPFVGWRIWAITDPWPSEEFEGLVLRGAWGRAWPDVELEARCLRPPIRDSSFSALLNARETNEHSESAPHPYCSCGIYARQPGSGDEQWVVRIQHLPKAAGFIAMTGTVIEGSKGFRAERARIVGPVEVWVPCADCGDQAATVATTERDFRGRCRRHQNSEETATTVEEWTAMALSDLGQRYRVPIIEREESREWT